MTPGRNENSMDRRGFMKTTAAAAVAGTTALSSAASVTQDASTRDGLDHRNERPGRMRYRKLGRTNFMCSRLVFGGGAALAGGRATRLLEVAFEQGINFYDLGYEVRYKGAEKAFAPFFKKHREEIWVVSKAYARAYAANTQRRELTVEGAKAAAAHWEGQLDTSLKNLDTDYVDAYYLMGVANPDIVKSDEIHSVYLKAHAAGKVRHFGFSTHDRAEEVLEAAIETGWYDIAMIAITPAGWYDYPGRKIMADTPPLKALRPILDRARNAGIGLIGMKAARHLAVKGNEADFDHLYDEKAMAAGLTPFQRSYAYVLENGVDAMNSDMQNFKHFEENLVAARMSHELFA